MPRQRERGPAHQNTFAFRHNPKSKKTEKILASPNEGLCHRCHEKVEWRKKYRRYKPLTTPASCAGCHQKTVRAAYHHLCDACAQSRKVCAGCMESKHIVTSAANGEKELEAKRELLEREIKGLHLRKQQRILREFDRTAGGMDVKGAIEKAQQGEEEDDDDFFDDEEEEEEEEEEGEGGEGKEGGEEEEEEEN